MKIIEKLFEYVKMKHQMKLMRKYDKLVKKMEKDELLKWYINRISEEKIEQAFDSLNELENTNMILEEKILMLKNQIEEMKNTHIMFISIPEPATDPFISSRKIQRL